MHRGLLTIIGYWRELDFMPPTALSTAHLLPVFGIATRFKLTSLRTETDKHAAHHEVNSCS